MGRYLLWRKSLSIHFTDKKPQIKYFCVGIIAGALYIHPIYANIQSKPPVSDTELYVNKQLLKNFQSNTFLHSTLIPHDHPLIEKFRKQYMSTDGYNYLSKIMKRSAPYRDFIIELLETENMPAELLFLPVIESGFFETATSKSGAVGIWQFMKNTAKEYNLEMEDTVDERYHLEKATEAACLYLKKAKEEMGSWTLAAAAYNAGKAGIRNQLNKQEGSSYYDLHLNNETSRYVFRILAIKEIMRNPKKYGFNYKQDQLYSLEPVQYITVDSTITNLASFAKRYKTNYKTIRLLNPWIRDFSLQNKSGKTYVIKVPK